MNKRISLYTVLFIFYSTLLHSQTTLRGSVSDAHNRQPIPFANIVVLGSQIGTVSDIDGHFELNIKQMPVRLQISYVGYETKMVEVNKETNNLLVWLVPKSIELPELIVKAGDNPAHRIIRKATEMRQRNNPEQLNSFEYVSYNKLYFTIDRKEIMYSIDTIRTSKNKALNYRLLNQKDYDSLMQKSFVSYKVDSFFQKTYLFLSESVSKRYFRYPDQNKEIILSTRTSGLQQPFFVLLATQFQSFSFYNDFVTILDKKYLNPVSNQAIGRYFYEITDTLYSETNDTIFVIQFRPLKNALFDGLKGTVHIHTRNYAIQAIKAEPVNQQGFFYVRIQQLYSLIDSVQWFPVQLNTNLRYKTLSFDDKTDTLRIDDSTLICIRKSIPLIGIGKSYIDSIRINLHLPKKIFNAVSVELLPNNNSTNENVWAAYRKESFGDIEKNTYTLLDSIGKEIKLEKKVQFLEYLLSGYVPVKYFNLSISNIFDYNRFEGFRANLDLQTNDRITPYASLGGYVGYAFTDQQTKYGARLSVKPYRFKDFRWIISFSNDVRETGNIIFFDDKALINNESFRRIYINRMDYQRQYSASLIFRWLRYVKTQIHLSENILQLSPPNYFPLFEHTIRDFWYREVWLGIKFLYKEEFMQTLKGRYSLGSKYPSLYLNIQLGDAGLFEPTYFKTECKLSIPYDFGLYGKTTLTLMGGYTPSDLPLSLIYSGKGTKFMDIMIYAENTFTTMFVNEFFYHSFTFAFLKHDIGKVLFRLGKFQPGLSLHHNMAIGSLKKSQLFDARTTDKVYTESGILFYNLFRQSFNTFGIGVFYRYGNYALPSWKNNMAIKISLAISIS